MSTATAAHGDVPFFKNEGKQNWLFSWIFSVDHKRIGILYIFSIFTFFLVGGAFALLVRLELFTPGVEDPAQYNKFMTMHGVIMVFLFIVPGIPATLGNFLLPLMIGAKDVAFPRLNLLSWWVYIFGAIFALISVVTSTVDTGWTFYAPYSISGTDNSVIMLVFGAFVLGFSSILTGMNFIVTIHKLRCPGMTWHKMPLMVWALYSASLIQVLATPIVGITLLMLIMERLFHIGIFDPALGGDPILFESFFWFYSHPVVYIMILPAFGIVSEIIPVFSRRPIFGYKAIAYSSVSITIISFIVWGHHLFVSGMSDLAAYIFSFLTMLVAIPTAIKIFNWIATMYRGAITLDTPMLFTLAFLFHFTIGGLTGLPLATLATDIPLHDTYYVVAHFHYTMQGGMVIAFFAGLHFWFPKMTGKMVNEKAGKLFFLMVFIGFNLTFIPQFILGLNGMPRRYADYTELPVMLENFKVLHQMSTVGALTLGSGYFLSLMNLLVSAFIGKQADANPFKAISLEWSATARAPIGHNFHEIPEVEDWPYSYTKLDRGEIELRKAG